MTAVLPPPLTERASPVAYARFSEKSFIYSYPAIVGDAVAVVCCACDLPGAVARTAAAAVVHVGLHIDRGDTVPIELLDVHLYDGALSGVPS